MMSASDDYESRGTSRRELGSKIGEAFWTYQNGIFSIVVPNSIKVDTVKVSVTCTDLVVDCTQTTINGNLTVNGDATITGNAKIGGNCTVGGNATVTGTVTAEVDVQSGGVSLRSHTHQGAHGRTSGPIG